MVTPAAILNPKLFMAIKPVPVPEQPEQTTYWKTIALQDPEVCALLRDQFRFYSNYSDPEKISDPKQAATAKKVLDKAVNELIAEFGLGAVYVMKSAYCQNGQPYKDGVAIWVCDVKPDVILEVPQEKEVEGTLAGRPPLLF